MERVSKEEAMQYWKKYSENHEMLLANIKRDLPKLEELLTEVSGHWTYEDSIYRFYHGSYKCYYIQDLTNKIVSALKQLAPDVELNEMFERIFLEGTGKKFRIDHNRNWLKHTRPMLEAFFHAKYFLEMAILYGKKLEKAPECLPSGWAGLLYLYNFR